VRRELLAMDTLLHCVFVLYRLMLLFFGGFFMQGNNWNFNVLSWKTCKVCGVDHGWLRIR
jgi:hypothetical protein